MSTGNRLPSGGIGDDPFIVIALASTGGLASHLESWQALLVYTGILAWAAWLGWRDRHERQ